jgi:6-phosphogluconolactonase/glucosamine-6-phosphate isomerase/deaminase
MFPASILRTHPSCHLFLDKESAGLLRPATLAG